MAELWKIFCDIWWTGTKHGWVVWESIIILMAITQLGWTTWRWIDDAEEEDKKREIYGGERKNVVFGNLFNIDLFGVRKDKTEEFWVHIIVATNIIGVVLIGVWPFAVIFGSCWGSLRLARGGRRLTKVVKNHNHDGRYVRK